jgi:hypothetical protein
MVSFDLAGRVGEGCAAPLHRLGLLQRIRVGSGHSDGPKIGRRLRAAGTWLMRLSGG